MKGLAITMTKHDIQLLSEYDRWANNCIWRSLILNYFHPLKLFLTHSSPSLQGDKVSLQLRDEIILEHL